MAHHRRGRPKNARAGCLLCKPSKAIGVDGRTRADVVADLNLDEQVQAWEGLDRHWSLWDVDCFDFGGRDCDECAMPPQPPPPEPKPLTWSLALAL